MGKNEHRTRPEEDWCVFTSGVVPAISAMIRQFTSLGDKILVQEPVYNMFYSVIEGNGRRVISSDLIYENSKYSVDWAGKFAPYNFSPLILLYHFLPAFSQLL